MHQSNRNVQYPSYGYTDLLQKHEIRISMSRKENPKGNTACEFFMKTLAYGAVYRTEHRDLAEAYASIIEVIEHVGSLGVCF